MIFAFLHLLNVTKTSNHHPTEWMCCDARPVSFYPVGIEVQRSTISASRKVKSEQFMQLLGVRGQVWMKQSSCPPFGPNSHTSATDIPESPRMRLPCYLNSWQRKQNLLWTLCFSRNNLYKYRGRLSIFQKTSSFDNHIICTTVSLSAL